MADKLVCGDCWYKNNDLPPDERKTLDYPVDCTICGTLGTEMVVLKGKGRGSDHVDPSELDGEENPDDYKIVIEWERITHRKEFYTFVIEDVDVDDLLYVRNGDFGDIAWDVAQEESIPENVVDYVDLGFQDDGPSSVGYELHGK